MVVCEVLVGVDPRCIVVGAVVCEVGIIAIATALIRLSQELNIQTCEGWQD